jgi:hypothetical protein
MFGAIAWQRANRHGALASVVVSACTFFFLTYSEHGTLLKWEADNFGYSMVTGFASLILVSLITRPESPANLKLFYDRLETRSELDEASEEEKTVDEPGHDLLFVHLFDSGLSMGWKHFYNRFRVDINGLVLAFGVVVALIWFAKGILLLP